MVEWLEGDPLNGIVITVTFFISLIIGRRLGRAFKGQDVDKGKILDSRINIILSFLIISAMTTMDRWYFPGAVAILCMMLAYRFQVFRKYATKMLFPLCLGSFIVIIQAFTYGTDPIDWGIIPLYREGVEYGLLIFSRVLASASVLLLLITTTSENELLSTMRWFRVPGMVIEISSFMIRYIRTFSHEARRVRLAQESRCGFSRKSGFLKRMHASAATGGVLINHAYARSDDIHRAMISRAWKPGLRYSLDIPPLPRKDLALGIVLSSGILLLTGVDIIL